MGLLHEFVKVFQGAEFRIHGAVVPDGIVGAEAALAAFHADRIERHYPHYVHSRVLEDGKFLCGGVESPLRGELTYIQLIYGTLRKSAVAVVRSLCAAAG